MILTYRDISIVGWNPQVQSCQSMMTSSHRWAMVKSWERLAHGGMGNCQAQHALLLSLQCVHVHLINKTKRGEFCLKLSAFFLSSPTFLTTADISNPSPDVRSRRGLQKSDDSPNCVPADKPRQKESASAGYNLSILGLPETCIQVWLCPGWGSKLHCKTLPCDFG